LHSLGKERLGAASLVRAAAAGSCAVSVVTLALAIRALACGAPDAVAELGARLCAALLQPSQSQPAQAT
jgi:hypothetical protein